MSWIAGVGSQSILKLFVSPFIAQTWSNLSETHKLYYKTINV